MTTVVLPSSGRNALHQGESAISRWGDTDWIVPSGSDIAASDMGLSGPLNAAEVTTSGMDVTIDTFEAFIGGAYVASDTTTTYTLPGDDTQKTLYLGYDYSATDTIIFGEADDFAAEDPKIPITFLIANSTEQQVKNIDEKRPLGYVDRPGELLAANYSNGPNSPLSLGTVSVPQYDVYEVFIYREAQHSSEEYGAVQINESTAPQYSMDYLDAAGGGFINDSQDRTEWDYIAGTKLDGAANAGIATQVIRICCPRQVVANGSHYPTLSVVQNGVGHNVSVPINGSFAVDTDAITHLSIYGGGDATGVIEVRGLGISYSDI